MFGSRGTGSPPSSCATAGGRVSPWMFPGQQAAMDPMLAEQQYLLYRSVAEDMFGVFDFLASAESDFVAGQARSIDGGWTHG